MSERGTAGKTTQVRGRAKTRVEPRGKDRRGSVVPAAIALLTTLRAATRLQSAGRGAGAFPRARQPT